ncbi:SAM-dependent methyltransferase [Microbacterium sp. EYE_5]|uniref:class I SAM-dependent methyltransferase n=1 Tax=unclassified Microbacterium TaxID=2609290 RepID=UPI002006CD5D|nr:MULTISPECIES: class I SAM-dependent methyltransferase [unclassified Microbacterium]MCK6079008.1 SAM-dependent methyltransferase [Microbacterium sp. EYE_382]MCK6084278.1 SAM-dependent methyltransferase [Microbacterium sp. EYE_384]MCK6123493.1 SAM-dependent methyltransferase [Microbacterium sp. EYE_80]MCK6125042.1 SAM-dependent methyltransferase [Microbacterium sp. EYE_79]MCK6142872.1 SAM-dependent methyltransferase [Microbacterium sp. EYE_39]
MEQAELTALLTAEGLRMVDEVGPLTTTAEVASAVSRLRAAGHAPDLVSAVVGQARLRVRAAAKFGAFADRMLFTRAGLEQATRLEVAARHAGRFRAAGATRVADLGCGIGGDALGLAGIGLDVLAVDADETTAALAAYNLAPFGDAVSVRHGRAEATDLTGWDAVWLDPARRTAGHTETSRTRPEDWSPSLDWAFSLAARMPVGIKLGPGLDRGLIPDDVEAQWISVDGSTLELVLWSGSLRRADVRRAALVIRGGAAAELTAPADTEDEPIRELGAFLHEPEGAVIRARLIGEVARTLQAGMVGDGIAYLTSDAAVTNAFVQSFRVREVMPLKVPTINACLQSNGIGTLEIKKRGVDIDPAQFRRKLTLRGEASATLLLTRVGEGSAVKRVAILADRV